MSKHQQENSDKLLEMFLDKHVLDQWEGSSPNTAAAVGNHLMAQGEITRVLQNPSRGSRCSLSSTKGLQGNMRALGLKMNREKGGGRKGCEEGATMIQRTKRESGISAPRLP